MMSDDGRGLVRCLSFKKKSEQQRFEFLQLFVTSDICASTREVGG